MQVYVSPTDPLVAELVERLDASQREAWEERAGIMQFDGQLPRGHAECLALLDLLCRQPSVLTGISVLQIELEFAVLKHEGLVELSESKKRCYDRCSDAALLANIKKLIDGKGVPVASAKGKAGKNNKGKVAAATPVTMRRSRQP